MNTLDALNQHTLGHIDCPACNELRASLLCSISADLLFSEAAHRWLESRSVNALPGSITARYIRPNTEESYKRYIGSLNLFFGNIHLKSVHIGHISAYIKARLEGAAPFIRYRRPHDARPTKRGPAKGKTPCPVKPKKVNQELGMLRQIMKRAYCWTAEMNDLYRPLIEEEEDTKRALSPEEQSRWLDVARMSARWNLVYWYSILAFNTCMSTDELRGIKLGDINIHQRIIIVQRGKTRPRARTIEIVGADVLWALERLIERAQELGANNPQHFLFPGRVSIGRYDPTTSLSPSGIHAQWNEVKTASGILWFRPYDTRHTAITRLAEAGVPTDVIMARAGHVSEKMRRHYTHISQSSQRRWIEQAQSYHQPQSFSHSPQYMAAWRA